jgi:hypothetical protein
MATRYEVTRSTTIAADPARVHGLVNDLHRWTAWSPWEDLDPSLARTYAGPASGVGAHYAWRGNRKAGEGWMEITGSTPERVDLDLAFMKPFENASVVSFLITPAHDPAGAGTEVTWRMSGELHGLMSVFGRVVSMDRLVGKDFEKGLARLKAAAEAP